MALCGNFRCCPCGNNLVFVLHATQIPNIITSRLKNIFNWVCIFNCFTGAFCPRLRVLREIYQNRIPFQSIVYVGSSPPDRPHRSRELASCDFAAPTRASADLGGKRVIHLEVVFGMPKKVSKVIDDGTNVKSWFGLLN